MEGLTRRYRRRWPTVEAAQLDWDNAAAVAELAGGTLLTPPYTDTPIVRLVGSVHPLRVGDYLMRDHVRTWYPMAKAIFEMGYEPCCDQCGR